MMGRGNLGKIVGKGMEKWLGRRHLEYLEGSWR